MSEGNALQLVKVNLRLIWRRFLVIIDYCNCLQLRPPGYENRRGSTRDIFFFLFFFLFLFNQASNWDSVETSFTKFTNSEKWVMEHQNEKKKELSIVVVFAAVVAAPEFFFHVSL